jgi:hypothetical protein
VILCAIGRGRRRNLQPQELSTFHVPCYSHDDPEEEKIKEIIELGENLRKKREKEETKLMTFLLLFLIVVN